MKNGVPTILLNWTKCTSYFTCDGDCGVPFLDTVWTDYPTCVLPVMNAVIHWVELKLCIMCCRLYHHFTTIEPLNCSCIKVSVALEYCTFSNNQGSNSSNLKTYRNMAVSDDWIFERRYMYIHLLPILMYTYLELKLFQRWKPQLC